MIKQNGYPILFQLKLNLARQLAWAFLLTMHHHPSLLPARQFFFSWRSLNTRTFGHLNIWTFGHLNIWTLEFILILNRVSLILQPHTSLPVSREYKCLIWCMLVVDDTVSSLHRAHVYRHMLNIRGFTILFSFCCNLHRT